MNQPVIGVIPSLDEQTSQYIVHTDHIEALTEAGGMPIVIPYEVALERVVSQLDGLYLTGGGDIEPMLFGEQPIPELRTITKVRDSFEIRFIHRFIALKKPIFAVCRGAQILNVALGGDMYQDMYSQIKRELIQHEQNVHKSYASHDISIERHSLLYTIVRKKTIRVNSRHHQANRRIAKELTISATAPDGIVEAIESRDEKFVLGVQWHPENLAVTGNPYAKKLYEYFVQTCIKK